MNTISDAKPIEGISRRLVGVLLLTLLVAAQGVMGQATVAGDAPERVRSYEDPVTFLIPIRRYSKVVLASGKTVQVIDAKTREPEQVLETGEVWRLAASDKGVIIQGKSTLSSSSGVPSYCLVDELAGASTMLALFENKRPSQVATRGVATDPKGKSAFVATAKGLLYRIRLEKMKKITGLMVYTKKAKKVIDSAEPLMHLAIDPKGKVLAAGTKSGKLCFPTPSLGSKGHPFMAHEGGITCLQFHPKRALLATGGHDKSVRIWAFSHPKPVQELTGHKAPVSAVSFSTDGKVIATGSMDGEIRLWNLKGGKFKKSLVHEELSAVHSLAFIGKDRLLIGGDDGLWIQNPGAAAKAR